MTERFLPPPALQILYVTHETSNCHLIAEMIKLGQKLEEIGLTDKETCTMSLDYGKRLLITAKNVDGKKMRQQDAVEIVDFDPLKNIMMVIGAKDPSVDAPVHWIIQKARHDINALLQINSVTFYEKLKGKLPTTEKDDLPVPLDRAKELLKTLRNGKTILLKNEGILFAGVNIKEIEKSVNTFLGGQQ
jgi:hypothetical protein